MFTRLKRIFYGHFSVESADDERVIFSSYILMCTTYYRFSCLIVLKEVFLFLTFFMFYNSWDSNFRDTEQCPL